MLPYFVPYRKPNNCKISGLIHRITEKIDRLPPEERNGGKVIKLLIL